MTAIFQWHGHYIDFIDHNSYTLNAVLMSNTDMHW